MNIMKLKEHYENGANLDENDFINYTSVVQSINLDFTWKNDSSVSIGPCTPSFALHTFLDKNIDEAQI